MAYRKSRRDMVALELMSVDRKAHGMTTPWLVCLDSHTGLAVTTRKSAFWQRCKWQLNLIFTNPIFQHLLMQA